MNTTITLKPVAEINEAISQIRVSGASFYQLVHETAVQTLAHTAQHGDYMPALNLLNALPKGTRRNGLAKWFEVFSNKKLRFQVDNETGQYRGRLDSDRAVADFNVEAANETNFADLTKEPPVNSTLDLEKFIGQITRVANNTKKNEDGSDKVDPTTRAMAARMVAQYRTLQTQVLSQQAA